MPLIVIGGAGPVHSSSGSIEKLRDAMMACPEMKPLVEQDKVLLKFEHFCDWRHPKLGPAIGSVATVYSKDLGFASRAKSVFMKTGLFDKVIVFKMEEFEEIPC